MKSAKSKIEIIVRKYESEIQKENGEEEKYWQGKMKDTTNEEENRLMKVLKEKVKKDESIHKWKDYHQSMYDSMNFGYKIMSEEDTSKTYVQSDSKLKLIYS